LPEAVRVRTAVPVFQEPFKKQLNRVSVVEKMLDTPPNPGRDKIKVSPGINRNMVVNSTTMSLAKGELIVGGRPLERRLKVWLKEPTCWIRSFLKTVRDKVPERSCAATVMLLDSCTPSLGSEMPLASETWTYNVPFPGIIFAIVKASSPAF
jgi:hypothetical protein